MNDAGRCVQHGHVTERCCVLFERLPPTTYLRSALNIEVHGDVVDIEGVGALRRAIVDATRRAIRRR